MAGALHITPELLRQLIEYDPLTGLLVWLPRADNLAFTSRWAGNPALAYTDTNGYLYGRVMFQRVYAHRAAWMIETGETPDDIDHLNGVRNDNRFVNLKDASRSHNMRNRALSRNNTSGVPGVSLTPWGTWKVVICERVVGSFRNKEDAIAARKAEENKMGFTSRHGCAPSLRFSIRPHQRQV